VLLGRALVIAFAAQLRSKLVESARAHYR
jgi:hypothetical protein